MSEIAVTGASGFVGSRLCRRLLEAGRSVRACTRNAPSVDLGDPRATVCEVKDIRDARRWSEIFRGVDAVVHLAALVHQPRLRDIDAYRAVNAEGTKAAASAALECGVRRFIFVSTIKVNGESTAYDRPFRPEDPPTGSDPYALSKLEAEQSLREISDRSGMDAVIIRPVLVYGPGARGNFLRLLKLVESGMPLPLGAIVNRRSILYVDNLCELIHFSCYSDAAAARVLLASDGQPLSTPELLRMIGRALERRVYLPKVPVSVLEVLASMLGRREDVRRLCGSLHVDSTWMSEVGWSPPFRTEEGLAATAEWFRSVNSDG